MSDTNTNDAVLRACVNCRELKPAGYAGWRGPGSQYCSAGQCRKRITELGGGTKDAKLIAELRDKVRMQEAHIKVQAEMIEMLKAQLAASTGVGGQTLCPVASAITAKPLVGAKRPLPQDALRLSCTTPAVAVERAPLAPPAPQRGCWRGPPRTRLVTTHVLPLAPSTGAASCAVCLEADTLHLYIND